MKEGVNFFVKEVDNLISQGMNKNEACEFVVTKIWKEENKIISTIVDKLIEEWELKYNNR